MSAWTLRLDRGFLLGLFCVRRPVPGHRGPQPDAATRQRSARRAAAMRALFPKLSARCAGPNYLAEIAAVDRYLGQAVDEPDLERRIREVEGRGCASCYVRGLDVSGC